MHLIKLAGICMALLVLVSACVGIAPADAYRRTVARPRGYTPHMNNPRSRMIRKQRLNRALRVQDERRRYENRRRY